jgi:hypothetical protein
MSVRLVGSNAFLNLAAPSKAALGCMAESKYYLVSMAEVQQEGEGHSLDKQGGGGGSYKERKEEGRKDAKRHACALLHSASAAELAQYARVNAYSTCCCVG